MRKIIALMMCAPLLAGCASSSSTMLSGDTAMISAWGAGLGDRPRVIKATLPEAAKLTRVHYYRYFVILRAEDVSTTGSIRRGGDTFHDETSHERPLGTTNFGGPNYPGHSYTTPETTELYVRLRFETTIRMYRIGEIDPGMEGVFNPDTILNPVATAP